jgi:hypothetical protein
MFQQQDFFFSNFYMVRSTILRLYLTTAYRRNVLRFTYSDKMHHSDSQRLRKKSKKQFLKTSILEATTENCRDAVICCASDKRIFL